jgi:hypothetical protein
MDRSTVLLCLLLLSSSVAAAQRSNGYWFAAPGGGTSRGNTQFLIHLGGGGEFAIGRGIGVGIEGGAVGPTEDYTDNVLGIASANGFYHFFPSKSARIDPFATAGYSLAFRRGTANLFNFGGGMNYWFTDTLALRFEFRDHVWGNGSTLHMWGFRFGFTFSKLRP